MIYMFIRRCLFCALALMFLQSCSVIMASGLDKVNTNKIELTSYNSPSVSLKRHSVERVRGKPVESVMLNDGNRLDVYEFQEYGDNGSYTRAGAYTALNVFTFGLWEIVGTPLEHGINVFDGRKFRSSVIYNQRNQVVDVRLEEEARDNQMVTVVDFKNRKYSSINRPLLSNNY